MIVTNWQETIEELKNNLDCCGINADYLSSFATYTYSAYKNKIPILLSGKNSIQIAKAISYIFNGKNLDIIDCNNEINNYSNHEVAIIKNFINSVKITEITDMVIKRDKFYLISVSHYEDLCFLPTSFFNYALPVILDFIINESLVIENMVYCNKNKDYTYCETKVYSFFNNKKKLIKLMDKLEISKLSQWYYLKIFSEAYSIDKTVNLNTDLIVFMLAYSYATNRKKIIKKFIEENNNNQFKNIKNLVNNFFDFNN